MSVTQLVFDVVTEIRDRLEVKPENDAEADSECDKTQTNDLRYRGCSDFNLLPCSEKEVNSGMDRAVIQETLDKFIIQRGLCHGIEHSQPDTPRR